MIVGGTMQVGDLSALLGYCMNILMSLSDAFYGICYDNDEYCQWRACCGSDQ